MTRLESLELINFRSHQRSCITFDGFPLVITGNNGAGKTNILEAISLFSPGRGLRRANKDDLAKTPENLGWKLILRGENPEPFEIINQSRLGEPRQIQIDGKLTSQSAMSEFLRVIWMVPSQDRLWLDSASDRRRFFDRIVLSFIPSHGDAVVSYEKSMRERNRLLKEQVSDAHWYRAVEDQMAEASRLIIQNRSEVLHRLNEEMEKSDSFFPKSKLSLQYESDFDEIADPLEFWENSRREERFSGTTKFGPHKVEFDALFVEKNMRAALCSTGEQKALLTSLMLANARGLIADGAFVVVLLDEVAAHLDETRRARLFDELVPLKAQVVMTGTERNLFEALGDRGRYILVQEKDNVSIVEPE